MCSIKLLLISFFIASTVKAEDLPAGWKVCKRSDPELKSCLKDAVIVAVKSLIGGNEKLGLPKLDPIFTELMTFSDSGSGGPVQMKAIFKKYTVAGLSGLQVQDINFDVKKLEIIGKLFVPLLVIKGKYDITGKILKLPLAGTGDVTIKLHDVVLRPEIQLNTIEKNGVKYFKVKKFSFSLTTSKAENHFDNLFNGDKKLGDQMNKLINENAEDVYREVGPSINSAYTQSFNPFIKQIFETIPMDVLSPP